MELFLADRAALSGGLGLNHGCIERVICSGGLGSFYIGIAIETRFRKIVLGAEAKHNTIRQNGVRFFNEWLTGLILFEIITLYTIRNHFRVSTDRPYFKLTYARLI
jgi:hypothetical protein